MGRSPAVTVHKTLAEFSPLIVLRLKENGSICGSTKITRVNYIFTLPNKKLN